MYNFFSCPGNQIFIDATVEDIFPVKILNLENFPRQACNYVFHQVIKVYKEQWVPFGALRAPKLHRIARVSF